MSVCRRHSFLGGPSAAAVRPCARREPLRLVRARSSLERSPLGRADPVGVPARELERHDTTLPARSGRLVDARPQRRGVDEAVRGVGSAAGLADHELVEVEPVLRDLEQGRARERRAGGGDETRTVGVEVLVVELDVVLRK